MVSIFLQSQKEKILGLYPGLFENQQDISNDQLDYHIQKSRTFYGFINHSWIHI